MSGITIKGIRLLNLCNDSRSLAIIYTEWEGVQQYSLRSLFVCLSLTKVLVEYNRKLKQWECWRPRGQKLATRNNWSFLSFSGLSWQICTVGVKTKAFRFIVQDRSISSNETSNFWLLFMMSGTSVISLLKLAIILEPVNLGKKTALSPVTQSKRGFRHLQNFAHSF